MLERKKKTDIDAYTEIIQIVWFYLACIVLGTQLSHKLTSIYKITMRAELFAVSKNRS